MPTFHARLVDPELGELECRVCGVRWRPSDRTGPTVDRMLCPNCGPAAAIDQPNERTATVPQEKP